MQIKINRFNDESVTIDFKPAVGEEYPTFEETLHMMFSALDGILHRFLDDKKIRKNWEFRESTSMTSSITFLMRCLREYFLRLSLMSLI